MARTTDRKTKQQRKKAEKTATYLGSLAGLAVVLLLAVVIWLVGIAENVSVLRVNDYAVKKDLYTCVYYCGTLTQTDWTQYGYIKNMNPYEQELTNKQVGEQAENWGEYFENITANTLQMMVVMTDTAAKGGYTYSEEVKNNVQSDLDKIQAQKGTSESFRKYMIETYGADIRKPVFKKYLLLNYQAKEFYRKVTESKALFQKYFGTDADAFEQTYQAHKDEIDVVSFRYYYLNKDKSNADKISQLQSAASEAAFRNLCNRFQNDESYTQQDGSLHKDMSLQSLNTLSTSEIVTKLNSFSAKAGDIYSSEAQIDGKTVEEVVYLVQPRAKDTGAYNGSNVDNWEFAAMGLLLQDYYNEHYSVSVAQKGINAFRNGYFPNK